MAVAKTGAMFKSLTFDGYSSRNYGVYITGEAVYNAPERAVEMISIPNRNGAFALDEGHFENIEVTYPAGVFADNEADFADAISDFRNLLCSRKGYCTLTDEYHPDEYREAVYKSGLEVTPSQLRAGEFTITFECKPQRFLNSGSTETTVTSGSTITNPTLFESNPLLKVWGYGDLNVNGYDITIKNEDLGDILLYPSNSSKKEIKSRTIDSLLNIGDTVYCDKIKGIVTKSRGDFSPKTVTSTSKGTATVTATGMTYSSVSYTSVIYPTTPIQDRFNMTINGLSFNYGSGPYSLEMKIPVIYTFSDSTTQTVNICLKVYAVGVPGPDPYYLVSFSSSINSGVNYKDENVSISELRGISTKSALGNPTYIDCDIGEAYLIKNSEIVSLDSLISLGSDLPKLSSGSNDITYDNTVTLFKIVPRWWKI